MEEERGLLMVKRGNEILYFNFEEVEKLFNRESDECESSNLQQKVQVR